MAEKEQKSGQDRLAKRNNWKLTLVLCYSLLICNIYMIWHCYYTILAMHNDDIHEKSIGLYENRLIASIATLIMLCGIIALAHVLRHKDNLKKKDAGMNQEKHKLSRRDNGT